MSTGGFFGSLLGKLPGLIMIDAVSLNTNILLALGFAATASAADEGIQKRYMNEEVE